MVTTTPMATIDQLAKHEPNQARRAGEDEPSAEDRRLYGTLASVPVLEQARFLNVAPDATHSAIQTELSCRDFNRLIRQTLTQTLYGIPTGQSNAPQSQSGFLPGPFNERPAQISYQACSPSGSKLLTLRTLSGPQPANHQSRPKLGQSQLWLEISDPITNTLLVARDLSDAHRDFILNSTFGYPSWDKAETQVVYVAESSPELPSPHSFLAQNRYTPDFGEQLTTIKHPAVFVFALPDLAHPQSSTTNGSLTRLSHPEHVYGQPVFGPQSDSAAIQLFCTAFASLPDARRLGLIYCQNRPSSVYELRFDHAPPHASSDGPAPQTPKNLQARRLSSPDCSARSPRVLDDRVVYLTNPLGGPHASCASLRQHKFDAPNSAEQTVVSAVEEPCAAAGFPGLYIDQLPLRAFVALAGQSTLVTSSIWGSTRRLLTVDLDSGTVEAHEGPCAGSATVWDTDGRSRVLVSFSQTVQTPQLWLGTLVSGPKHSFSWTLVTHLKGSPDVQARLGSLESETIRLPQLADGPTEVVLTRTRHRPACHSLVLVPHGGPHSTVVDEFSAATATMALRGYAMAYVNYPGSLGFGQRWIDHLTQHLGEADVMSCKRALDHLTSLDTYKAAFVNGGSHGGFIGAHLTARFKDTFRGACLRNPVVDLVGTASGASDIPDWSFAEAGLAFPVAGSTERAPVSVDEKTFKVLRDASPVKWIEKVTTPTLLLLGDRDRRVGHSQGLAWFHGLKGNGVRTEAVMFENNSHPLSGVEAEVGALVGCLEFFREVE